MKASYPQRQTPQFDMALFTSLKKEGVIPNQCQVIFTLETPRVVYLTDFITDDECQHLITYNEDRLQRSEVATAEGERISDYRTSQGVFLKRGETSIVTRIEDRLEALTLWPTLMTEGFNVLRYENGGEFKEHHDFFMDEHTQMLVPENGGNRVGTVILYLNTVVGEGDTQFPDCGISVYPRKGSLLMFTYPTNHPQCPSRHSGNAVVDQLKYVAVKWFREGPFIRE